MSTIDAQSIFGPPLRRTRSVGDIPRQPSPIHRHRVSIRSDRHSDRLDQWGGEVPGSLTSRSISRETSEPLAISLPPQSPPAQTFGEPNRPSRPGGQPPSQQTGSLFYRTLTFLGIGRGASRERRTIVALYFTLSSGFVQIIIISIILGFAGTRLKSPTQPNLTEWVACDRPLGIWACIWVVRAVLGSSLTYWGFLRDRKVRQRRGEEQTSGISDPSDAASHRVRNSRAGLTQDLEPTESPSRLMRDLPYTRLYSRWFLTAHILEYTSINTCRHSSPHIWWLTFGILCLMYLSVLEVVILSFVVFVVAPILFLFWNVVLICMGRHPLQTGSMIHPEIGKLSKSVVDRIPLVTYIPPPEDSYKDTLAIPDPAYSYPPKHVTPSVPSTRKRFRFIKRKLTSFKGKQANGDDNSGNVKDGEKAVQTWEDHWEKGEYPFVVLEGNRAACAICLMDFEEPKRLDGITTAPPGVNSPELGQLSSPVQDKPITLITETSRNTGGELRLADAGEKVQPLRLLECGHVFHKICLDPWLTEVSGRCPVCQRAVVLPETRKNKERR